MSAITTAILELLRTQAEPVRERVIHAAVQGRRVSKLAGLRDLVAGRGVVRHGAGTRGNPYRYELPSPDSLVSGSAERDGNVATAHRERAGCSTAIRAEATHSPIQSGWLVAYHGHDGKLRGGSEDREHGIVRDGRLTETGWVFSVMDGTKIPAKAIVSVAEVAENGRVVAAWTVRKHGLDGREDTGTRKDAGLHDDSSTLGKDAVGRRKKADGTCRGLGKTKMSTIDHRW